MAILLSVAVGAGSVQMWTDPADAVSAVDDRFELALGADAEAPTKSAPRSEERVSKRRVTPAESVPPVTRGSAEPSDRTSTDIVRVGAKPAKQHLTVGTRSGLAKMSALLSSTITFSEYPTGTAITAQYPGIVFGPSPFTASDGANPTSPVLSPGSGFTGEVTGRFVTATGSPAVVAGFGLDVGFIDDPGSTAVDAFNSAGGFMGRVVISTRGIVNVTVTGYGIASFRVHVIGTERRGFAVDNVAFPEPTSAFGIPLGQTIGSGLCNCSGANHPYQWLTDRPVNTATGALTERFVDVAFPSPGLPLQFARSYTSVDTTNGPLGPGWTHPYLAGITVDSTGNVTVRAEDGQQLVYVLLPGGGYATPPGARSILTSVVGGGWTLTKPDQSTLAFDSGGRLTAMKDRLGVGLTLSHVGGVLSTVTDSAGRVLTFTHAGGLLTKVELADGRYVEYGYTGGRLTSVRNMRGKVSTFTYDTGGRLESMTDPLGHQAFFNVYDPVSGRVVEQTDPRGKTTTFAWDPLTQTSTRTDPRGNEWVEQYQVNVLMSATDPEGNTTTFDYDSRLNRTSVTDPRGATTTMTYDSAGNMLTRTGPAPSSVEESWTYTPFNAVLTHTNGRGKTTSHEYFPNQLPKKVTDPLGRETSYTWTSNGLPDTVTDPRGKITDFGYDAAGNRTSVLSPEGNLTTFGFDGHGRRTSMIEARGNASGVNPNDFKTTWTYNAQDQVTKVTDALGRETTSVYDDAGNLTKVTDADGKDTTYDYNTDNQVTKVTDPRGAETTTSYDDNGNVSSVTTPAGTTTFTYDDVNRLSSEVTPRGNVSGATAANFTRSYTYDANGNRLAESHPTAGTTATAYDELNRPVTATDAHNEVTTTTYDDNNNVVTVTDPLNRVTQFGYDNADQRTSMTDPLSKVTSYGYDASGNQTTITSPLGNIEKQTFNGDGLVVSRVEPRGNVSGGTPSAFTTTYTYDAAGHRLTESDPLSNATTYTYDRVGNLLTSKDARNNTTTYTYDVLNRLKTVKDPLNFITSYDYNATGQITQRTDANNHDTDYTYDPAGRLTQKTTGVGTWKYDYDAAGNLTKTETAAGTATGTAGDGTILRAYDPLGRLTGIDYSDSTPDVTYGYDELRRTSTTDNAVAGAATETYGYDDAGQLTSITRGTAVFTYTYDDNGRLATRAAPDGRTITQTWDDDSRPTGVTSGSGGPTASYTYDAAGNRTGTTFGNGITETRTYDNAGRLADLTTKRATTIISGHTFTRDANGNPTKIIRAYPGTQGENYTYDANNRLTSVCWAGTCNPGTTAKNEYTYDGVGNRLTEYIQSGPYIGTITATFNAADQLTKTVKGPYLLKPAVTTNYTYDANGNQITAGPSSAVTTYTYDLENRLKTSATGSTTTSYTYDGDGKRLKSVTGANATTYTWDPNNPLPELTAETKSTGTRTYLNDPAGDPIALTNPGTGTGTGIQYHHPNGTGSISAVTDATNARTASYNYEPFGTTRTSPTNQDDVENPIRFASEYQDTNSNRYHLRARDYDPATGRFNSLDPMAQDITNPFVADYVYVNNQPNVFTDPSGQCDPRHPFSCLNVPNPVSWLADGADRIASVATTECTLPNPEFVSAGFNLLYGSFSAGSGAVMFLGGSVAEATVIGIPIGISIQAYGVVKMITGFFRVVRGVGQLDRASDDPFVEKTPVNWVGDVVLGVVPGGGSVTNFLGGLP